MFIVREIINDQDTNIAGRDMNIFNINFPVSIMSMTNYWELIFYLQNVSYNLNLMHFQVKITRPLNCYFMALFPSNIDTRFKNLNATNI